MEVKSMGSVVGMSWEMSVLSWTPMLIEPGGTASV